MKQTSLFDLEPEPAAVARPETETIDTVSRMPDKRSVRRLVSLSKRVQQEADPIDRAKVAAEIRDLAETIVEANIREANIAGATWREIGANLGVPFQTLFRRYGGGI